MHPQLAPLEREFQSALDRLRDLRESSGDEWGKRPMGGGWSAAECVAHLNVTSQAYLPALDAALERARTRGGNPPRRFRRDLLGWLIWKTTGPAGKFKTRTAPAFVPAMDSSKAALVGEFERLQAELTGRLRASDGLPIHQVKLPSPFDPRARYTLYSAFTIIPGHQHRHLAQAERAVASAKAIPGGERAH